MATTHQGALTKVSALIVAALPSTVTPALCVMPERGAGGAGDAPGCCGEVVIRRLHFLDPGLSGRRGGNVDETVSGGCPDSTPAQFRLCPDGYRTEPDKGYRTPLRWAGTAAPPEVAVTAVEDFAHYLRQLHAAAGTPSRRQMAARTGYGKSTISEAFGGRRLPTWQVVEKLATALGADADDLRDRWVVARGRPTAVQPVPDWLTSVRTDIPEITTGPSLEEACAITPRDPKRALSASWEVLRVCALQLARCSYGDIPGSWSSNVVETYQRAEKDGLLPAGVTAVANTVHHSGGGPLYSRVTLTMEQEIADSLQTRWLRFVAGEGEHWKVPSPTALAFDLEEWWKQQVKAAQDLDA